ncbi:MAG: OmpA family protein [Proteobacteria bacterium]|nr:OmpA family protein [Pseudomonadota bacterium]
MGVSLPKHLAFFVVLSGLVSSGLVSAQDDSDYDSKYENEVAAGTIANSDESAAEAETKPAPEAPVSEPGPSAGTGGTPAEKAPAAPAGAPVLRLGVDRDKLAGWDFGGNRQYNTLFGPTGLFYTRAGNSGDPGTFSLGLHGAYFKYSNYLIYGDTNTYMWGNLNLRVTPIKHLEVFADIESTSNENDKGNPTLIQTLGDFSFGVKGFLSPGDFLNSPVARLFSFALIFDVSFKTPIGEVGASGEGASFGLGLASSFDFTEINRRAPIRAHLDLGYLFNNTAKMIEDIERNNGGCGEDLDGDGLIEDVGCLGPVERTALGIDRNDNFHIGVGIEALLPYVTPLIEYRIEIPVNRQDFACPQAGGVSLDSCLAEEGIKGMRQWMTFGVRVLPPVEALAIDFGVDVGLSGYAPTVHELAAQAPYKILFGLSYSFDPFPDRVECEETVEPGVTPVGDSPTEPLPPVVITGLVHDAESEDKPVAGATVSYVGHEDLNPHVTGDDGRFRSYAMPPGPVTVHLSAKGYEDGSCTVQIPDPADMPQDPQQPVEPEVSEEPVEQEGEAVPTEEPVQETPEIEVPLACPLKAIPPKAKLSIVVSDENGNPISDAAVVLDGPTGSKAQTSGEGKVERELDAGTYLLAVEKEGYYKRSRSVEMQGDTNTVMEIQLRNKKTKASVIIKQRRIVIRRKIHFAINSDEIKSNSFGLMDEIADMFLNHPELKLVEIQGHTDNKGRSKYNIRLSERRAKSVRQYLVDSGVPASRLRAKGYGPLKPVAPNFTSQGRARNRRVEFHIIERGQ